MTSGFRWIAAGGPSAILLALVEDDHLVGDIHDQRHVVLDDQARDAAVADLQDQLGQLLGLVDVQPGGRLVEQQQGRLGGQGPGELDQPLAAEGQVRRRSRGRGTPGRGPRGSPAALACGLAGPRARSGAGSACRRGSPSASAGCRPTMTFSRTVMCGKSFVVWNVRAMPSAAMAWGFQRGDPLAAEEDLALVGRERPGDQVEERGLARAVGADDRLDRARAARRS